MRYVLCAVMGLFSAGPVPAADPVTVVVYTSATCGPCKRHMPAVLDAAASLPASVVGDVIEVQCGNGGEADKLAEKMDVTCYPTTDIVRGGTGLVRVTGAQTEAAMRALIADPEGATKPKAAPACGGGSCAKAAPACRPGSACGEGGGCSVTPAKMARYDAVKRACPPVKPIAERAADAPVAVTGGPPVIVDRGETGGEKWFVMEWRDEDGRLARDRHFPELACVLALPTEEDADLSSKLNPSPRYTD